MYYEATPPWKAPGLSAGTPIYKAVRVDLKQGSVYLACFIKKSQLRNKFLKAVIMKYQGPTTENLYSWSLQE